MHRQRIPSIDHAAQVAYAWINDVGREIGHPNRMLSHQILRVGLHALRDRLPLEEVHRLGAHLPLIIRGLYYEGFVPTDGPVVMQRDQFHASVAARLSTLRGVSSQAALRAVVTVLADHVPPAELEALFEALPADLQAYRPLPA